MEIITLVIVIERSDIIFIEL